MGLVVVTGALCMCTNGIAPSTLVAISNILVSCRPVMTILDYVPMLNVMTFGVCRMGMVPLPCVPTAPAPWIPFKPNVIAGKGPILTMESKLICARGAVISIIIPGQFNVMA